MADPVKYVPGYSYTGWQTSNPTKPLPAPQVDNDFANIQTSISQSVDAIKDVRRSDGKLKNGIVTADALITGGGSRTAGSALTFDIAGNIIAGTLIAGVVATDYTAGLVSSNNSAADLRDFIDVPAYAVNRAAMKLLDSSKDKVAIVQGEGGRNGLFLWKDGNYTTQHALDTLEGVFVKSAAVASNLGSWVREVDWISPKYFGAIGDNTADDTAALNAWFSVLMGTSYGGLINGKFRAATALSWNFVNRRTQGVTIVGRSANDDYISVTDTTVSPAFLWHSNSLAFFYGAFRDFGVRTSRAGVGFQIGQDDFADAWNQCDVSNLVVNNSAANAANISIRLNHILHSRLLFTANAGGSGRPEAGTAPGLGTAVQFRQVIACHGAPHAGNGNKAHEYLGGFCYGNIWTGVNIEEVDTAITGSGANATNNRYLGGNLVAKTLFNCTAGSGLRVDGATIQQYTGFSIGSNLTGVLFEDTNPRSQSTQIPFATAFPTTGTLWANTTGRKLQLFIRGGSVTNILITSPDTGTLNINPQTTNQCPTITLYPGWSITPTYTGTPAWSFMPA